MRRRAWDRASASALRAAGRAVAAALPCAVMGHRRNRKRDRRSAPSLSEANGGIPQGLDWLPLNADRDLIFNLAAELTGGGRATVVKHCGTCREFVEDQEGGRGRCLHPGSGVLCPWTDTLTCEFYVPQRFTRLSR